MNACYRQLIIKIMYEQIKTKENYDKLLASGMFWEFHPELTGNWEIDKAVILASLLVITITCKRCAGQH